MSDVELLDAVEVTTGAGVAPTAAVVWLHGLGADGHDFEPLVPVLGLPPELAVRFVFPHAPVRPVTINAGMAMRAWYDVRSPELDRDPDDAGLDSSAALVARLLQRCCERGIAPERTVLAGFSQGGAMTYEVGLGYPEPLAGLLVLSGYAPRPDRLAPAATSGNGGTPIFHGHGTLDPLVPHELGARTVARLRRLGYDVRHESYPVEHGVDPREVADVGAWLAERLAEGIPQG